MVLDGQSYGGELRWRERVSLEGTGVGKAGCGRFCGEVVELGV